MASVVFILGAGASKQGGAPIMKEFLRIAEDLWKTKGLSDAEEESFAAVFEAMSALQSVYFKSHLDIQNVEEVFSAFEMANTLKRLGDYPLEKIQKLPAAMKTVIVSTIEKTLLFPVRDKRVIAPPPYESFAELVYDLRKASTPRQSVAIITFNYDMAVDYAFHRFGIPVEYGLENEPVHDAVPLLKLHGSLNWRWCSQCEVVVPWTLRDHFSKYNWTSHLIERKKRVVFPIGSVLASFSHGEHPVDPAPAVVVPPTWNKPDYHRVLARVWARAALELSTAGNIFVIGYSLPESDLFFRYLYALGTVGTEILKRFWVFDIDTSGRVRGRFEQLLGRGAEQVFDYPEKSFEESISKIREAFRFDDRLLA
jgi:hypothetical protein